MSEATNFERISELQNEILSFTWGQVGDKADKFYVQGKITDDDNGSVTSVEGNLTYVVVDGKVLDNKDAVGLDGFRESSRFIRPRIVELHDLLCEMQGKSPVRFRWSVDTRNQQVESDWTYYHDLTEEEKKDDFWENWEGDFAWKAQLEADLAHES